jgi:hypothetical protein
MQDVSQSRNRLQSSPNAVPSNERAKLVLFLSSAAYRRVSGMEQGWFVSQLMSCYDKTCHGKEGLRI